MTPPPIYVPTGPVKGAETAPNKTAKKSRPNQTILSNSVPRCLLRVSSLMSSQSMPYTQIRHHICGFVIAAVFCRTLSIHTSIIRVVYQSASCVSTLILSIMTNKPIVTMMSNAKLNQPITMALVPTPDLTLPLPKSCAMMEAATDAVCCHSTDTRTKIEAIKMMARAICDTGRLGKGLISRSEPSLSSSSCQPGKVASSRKQTKAKMMAMISR